MVARSFTAAAAVLLVPLVAVQFDARPADSGPPSALLAPGTIVYGASIAGQSDTVDTLAPGSSSPVTLLSGNDNYDEPVLSPNGEYLAFREGADEPLDSENVYIEDLATGAPPVEVLDTANGLDPIAYYSFDATSSSLYADQTDNARSTCDFVVFPLDQLTTVGSAGPPPPVAGSVFTDGTPYWSLGRSPLPNCTDTSGNDTVDGQPIDPVQVPGTTSTFLAAEGRFGLYEVTPGDRGDPSGTPIQTTTDRAGFGDVGPLAVSADGSQVAWVSQFDADGEITPAEGNLVTAPTDGSSGASVLTGFALDSPTDHVLGEPVWSADGSEVLAAAEVGGVQGIWAFPDSADAQPSLVAAAAAGADWLAGVVPADANALTLVHDPFTTSDAWEQSFSPTAYNTATSGASGASGPSGAPATSPCLTASSNSDNEYPVPGCGQPTPDSVRVRGAAPHRQRQ